MSDLTYAEVGFTRPGLALPAGYHHVTARARVGAGDRAFQGVIAEMREWGIHRGAGLTVRDPQPPAIGVRVNARIGVGPLGVPAPCKVVWVHDEEDLYGYGFGTLPGHPATGEEAFIVTRAGAGGAVYFEVRAFSRPATWYTRLGGPVARAAQRLVTNRYVAAARRAATT
ncbi:DUF1990 family protein [Luedemannella flava]|uniref:DUF1990 family protein n=1 Tax=Luedemannella flava TaxID=349316 RepID=A0ABN2MA26_9ACTN